LAVKFDRKVLLNGKSMITNLGIAKREGFIDIPDDVEIKERQIDKFPDNMITIITTGSQGEPMSALTRMARGRHKSIKIKNGDTIILSSRFIPGNERAITSIINKLYRMGADVVYENQQMSLGGNISTGRTLVDGKGVGDVGEIVLRDRMRLGEHGMVIIQLAVDEKTGKIISGPQIMSRGFVFEDQAGSIFEDAKGIVLEVLEEFEHAESIDWTVVESEIEKRLKKFFYKIIERRPLVLPLIMML